MFFINNIGYEFGTWGSKNTELLSYEYNSAYQLELFFKYEVLRKF